MKPDKRLINTKVYVNGHSEEILEKVFSLGFEWDSNPKEVGPSNMFPFLLFGADGRITATTRMDIYKKAKEREVSEFYILGLEPLLECDFRIFDKVLVRNDDHGVWMPKLFGKYLYNQKQCFLTIDNMRYSQCVPYECNEHLAYTADNPCGNKEQTENEQ